MKQKLIFYMVVAGMIASSVFCGYAIIDGLHSGSVYDIVFRSSSHSAENSNLDRYVLKTNPVEYWANITLYFVFCLGGLWSAYYVCKV
ncbi:MAG: hypothetical protein EBR72_09660, partial [Bacteroidetes bacterium]|nr:hypothetical protein [Bacteroidota bacterium]